MNAQRVDELSPNRPDRIKRRSRILKDDSKAVAIAAMPTCQIERTARESDAALGNASCRGEDANDRKCSDRFA